MAKKYDFKWSGFKEEGKWTTNKLAIVAFEDEAFRARIKKACSNLSFYDPDGKDMEMEEFIEARVKNFNPDLVDDDLSTLGASTVPAATPNGKRKNKRD